MPKNMPLSIFLKDYLVLIDTWEHKMIISVPPVHGPHDLLKRMIFSEHALGLCSLLISLEMIDMGGHPPSLGGVSPLVTVNLSRTCKDSINAYSEKRQRKKLNKEKNPRQLTSNQNPILSPIYQYINVTMDSHIIMATWILTCDISHLVLLHRLENCSSTSGGTFSV